jgi:hypothetical protein
MLFNAHASYTLNISAKNSKQGRNMTQGAPPVKELFSGQGSGKIFLGGVKKNIDTIVY